MAHCREYIFISLYLSTCRCLTSFDLPLLGSPQSSKLDLNVLRWGCFLAPVKYTGVAELQHDIDNLKAALTGVHVEEAFLPVAAPSSAIPDRKNEFYRNEEELVIALAEGFAWRSIVIYGLLGGWKLTEAHFETR